MLEQFRTTYEIHTWVRYTTCIATLVASILLLWLSGGFPPQPWRFLAATLPHVPELWALKGPLILLPLAALVLLTLALLMIWGFLAAIAIWIALQHWRFWRELRQFDAAVQHAQQMSLSDGEHQPWWREPTEPIQPITTGSRGALHLRPDAPLMAPQSPLMSTTAPRVQVSRAHTAVSPPPVPANAFRFVVGTGLDPGIKRKNKPNEDRLLAFQGTLASGTETCPFGLFVIADGMGGHANGQEASRLAIHHIRETVIPALLSNVEIHDEDIAALLLDGVQQANLAVYKHNQMYRSDIGTTLTAVLIVGHSIAIANVGDSRTYLFLQDKSLTKVTQDHSVVAGLVASGEITPDEIYTHPRRNEIYRCLGENPLAEVDMFTLLVERGAAFVLCSDGLWEMVRDPAIEAILRRTLPDAAQASQALVQAALDGGGLDNISVIVVHAL